MPVILATQEPNVRWIMVHSQPGQIVQETLSRKKTFTKKGWWSVEGVGPGFKLRYCEKSKISILIMEGAWKH
jgi:hypothetical protein